MKPSNSKSALAARQRKSRQGKKDRAERDRQHAAALDKLSVTERLDVDRIVKETSARVKAEAPARVAAVIAKAAAKHAKEEAEEQLTTMHKDRDGNIVRERMRDRYGEVIQNRPEPAPAPQPARRGPLTHAERVAPPFSGKPMNQWTMAELEAHKQAHRTMYAPRYDHGSQEWFIAACRARNVF